MAIVEVDERQALIERYLPLASRIARRFTGRDEGLDDLRQIAAVALIKAIDRRDPARAELLPAYLARCVDGELRRHLRDRCGVVRVPRRVQAAGEAPAAPRDLDETADSLAAADELDTVALARVLVSSGARSLAEDERRVLLLRYFVGLSQSETGALEGVSQAHVSRLQGRALAKMRASLSSTASQPR